MNDNNTDMQRRMLKASSAIRAAIDDAGLGCHDASTLLRICFAQTLAESVPPDAFTRHRDELVDTIEREYHEWRRRGAADHPGAH